MQWSFKVDGFLIRWAKNAIVVKLPMGEYSSLDEPALERVRRVLLGLASVDAPPYVVVDMGNVGFLAAGLVGILVSTWKRLRERARRLAVCGLQPACDKLFDVLRLWELVDIYPTQPSALRAITPAAGVGLADEQTVRIRVERRGVPWDPNLMRHDFIAGDNEPICSMIVPREEGDIWSLIESM